MDDISDSRERDVVSIHKAPITKHEACTQTYHLFTNSETEQLAYENNCNINTSQLEGSSRII